MTAAASEHQTPVDQQKLKAAAAALEHVRSGMTIGLGSGSTAAHFIRLLGEAIASGRLKGVSGIPTSIPSEHLAREAGIPLFAPIEAGHCDIVVDGADEVTPELDLIKGLGGALLREKIVAQASRTRIIIVDRSKCVDRLGTKSPLPVEVNRWGHEWQAAFLKDLGGQPVLRASDKGTPFITDNDNLIYDVTFDAIPDPAELERTLLSRAGIVETGLFLGVADVVLVAHDDHIKSLSR